MPEDISNKLVVAISSRALFDLDQSNIIYEKEGLERYAKYQVEHENEILKPGIAFSLVEKLLQLNQKKKIWLKLYYCPATVPIQVCAFLIASIIINSILLEPLSPVAPALIAMFAPLVLICFYPHIMKM